MIFPSLNYHHVLPSFYKLGSINHFHNRLKCPKLIQYSNNNLTNFNLPKSLLFMADLWHQFFVVCFKNIKGINFPNIIITYQNSFFFCVVYIHTAFSLMALKPETYQESMFHILLQGWRTVDFFCLLIFWDR